MSAECRFRCTCSPIAFFLLIWATVASVVAAATDDQERPPQEQADRAKVETLEEKFAALRARAQEQHVRAVRARAEAAQAAAERDRALEEVQAKISQLITEVAEAEIARRATVEKDGRPATRPADRLSAEAEELLRLIGKEGVKAQELIESFSRPATQPAEGLKEQMKRNLAEIEALRAENARQKRELAELNKKLAEEAWMHPILPLPPQQNGPQAPNDLLLRSGTIKARKNINGVEYATISLGEKEHVQKGMKLRVMDGDILLGHLIIDLVETDESVGHLEGKTIDQVKPGSVVRPFPR